VLLRGTHAHPAADPPVSGSSSRTCVVRRLALPCMQALLVSAEEPRYEPTCCCTAHSIKCCRPSSSAALKEAGTSFSHCSLHARAA
jgi:hypothetical protein